MGKYKRGVALKMEGDTEVDVHNLDGKEDVYVTWFWRVADNLVVDETEIAVFRVGEQSDSIVCGVLKSKAIIDRDDFPHPRMVLVFRNNHKTVRRTVFSQERGAVNPVARYPMDGEQYVT